MENNNLKVAFVSINGQGINGAFGSAKYFKVIELNQGKVVGEELREIYNFDAGNALPMLSKSDGTEGKMSFNLAVHDPSKEKHLKVAKTISDCNVVIARGMCANARDSIKQFKMTPYLTDIKDFDTAVDQLVGGTLVDLVER